MRRIVPTIVDSWQFECCGDPFAVGDRVAWQLSLNTDLATPPEAITLLAGTAGEVIECDASGTRGNLMSSDGLTVWVHPERAPGPAELTGALVQDHHGLVPEATPKTPGTIARIRAISVAHENHDQTYVPIPGTERLRDVGGFTAWQAGRKGSDRDERDERDETSLLVELVIDTDPRRTA